MFGLFLILCLGHIQGYAQEPPADPIWRQALGGALLGKPASQAESVAVLLDSGNLRCYSRRGTLLWDYYAGGKLGPFITRSREGTSYISRTNGTLIAVNRSGRELWKKSPGEPLAAPVIVGWDGRIFVPTIKGLSCYTAAGYLLWFKKFDTPLVFGPLADLQGGLILGLDGGKVLHINHLGETRSFDLPGNPALVVPVLSRSREGTSGLFPPEQLVLVAADRTGKLSILGETGESPLPQLPGSPLKAISRNDKIAFVLQNNRVVLLSYNEKNILWTGETQNLSGAASASVDMLYDERGIYVVSRDGAAGFTEDGRRLWIIHIQGAVGLPVFSDDGLLYSGGANWILHAYRLEERILGMKQSVYGPVPEGSYGLGAPGPSSWDGYYFRNDETEITRELDAIEKNIHAGKTGANEPDYVAYLMELASGALSSPGTTQIHVTFRVRALQLLAYMGSRETIPFLVRVFNRDPEPLVQATAAETIGRIGVDPDGVALRAFSMKIYSAAAPRNEQVLTAVAGATASLCRFSGPPLSDAGIKMLVLLANDTMPSAVRNQARKEMDSLR